MQGATDQVIEAVRTMVDTIAKLSAISACVSSATAEQSYLTQSISANMETAERGVATVTTDMSDIAAAADVAIKQMAEASRQIAV